MRRGSAAGIVVVVVVVGLAAPASAQTGLTTQDLTSGLTPEQLATSLVGEGVAISNVRYTGADVAAGGFSGPADIIGFGSGIVLSSGAVSDVVGPNESTQTGIVNGTPGDPQLDALASSGDTAYTTQDAAVLEFDFVPEADQVFFDYVFGSEEYDEFVGSQFNDVFGFFVNGENCAVVNGDPVTVNTIHNGNPDGFFGEVPPSNPELYRRNTLESGAPINTELDGLTTVLRCTAAVTPGASGTMKLAIADTSDAIYDAAVFIRAGSFTTVEEVPPGDPGVARIDGGTGSVADIAIEACRVAVPFGQRANRVVLARDDVFADALAGTALVDEQTCVLFTPGGPDQPLAAATRAEIDRLLPPGGTDPRPVDILGGTAAVSAAAEQELRDAGYTVRRFGGPTRFETAAGIATSLGTSDDVILAWGQDWPDAITGGAFAAATSTPVLLTPTDALHPASAQAMEALGVERTYVIGGTAVISEATAGQAPGPTRVSGPNRMGTAVAVAQSLWLDSGATPGEDFVVVNLERADAWQLALAATPVSAQFDAPQLGVATDRYPDETSAFLGGRGFDQLPAIVLVGDLAFIGDDVAQQIEDDVQPGT